MSGDFSLSDEIDAVIMGQINGRIQVLRGVAIIAVILIHTCPKSPGWQIFFRPFVNFGVPLFFFLSGYLTRIETQDWLAIIKRRFLRVGIPYVIWGVLYSLYNGMQKAIIHNLLTAQGNYAMYFILVYLQLVLLSPIIGALARSKYSWTGWLITPISIVLIPYLSGLGFSPFGERVEMLYYISFLGWFSFYYLGIKGGNGLVGSKPSNTVLLIILLLSIPIQMAESGLWYKLGHPDFGSPYKLSALFTNLVLLMIVLRNFTAEGATLNIPLLKRIGDYSFGIYLCHIMILDLLQRIPFWGKVPFVINSTFVLVISVFFVYLVSHLLGNRISRLLGFSN